MRFRTRLTATCIAVAVAFSPIHAVADWMDDFYNSAGAAANVTAPQAISSQSLVGYSGGGLSWRVPNKNFQPFSLNPPSLKAGCGGIDFYLGAYSFPNKDEFVQALRNFGQAAIGYFFELALRTMAPEIAATLDVINDLAQRINQMGQNTCQAAKQFVDTVAGDAIKSMTSDASGYARSIGEYADQFDAMRGVQSGGYALALEQKYKQNYGKAKADVVKADYGKTMPVEVNVVRWALDNGNAADLTEDEKDLVMSLVGPTLILRRKATSDGADTSLDNQGKPKTIDFKNLLGDMTGAAVQNVDVLTCGVDPECLDPQPLATGVQPFSMRALTTIAAIRENIQLRQPAMMLTADQQTLLKMSSVPLYRAAAMAEGTGVAAVVANALVYDLADYAAVDAAYRFVTYYLQVMSTGLAVAGNKLPKDWGPELALVTQRIQDIRIEMHDQINLFYAQKGNPFEKLAQLDAAERAMYSNLNAALASNARFGKN